MTKHQNSPGKSPGPVLAAALQYASRGWHVIPVPPGTKKSHKSAEQHGRPWGMTIDPDEIRADHQHWPRAGVGVVMGRVSGIFDVEVDVRKDGPASLAALEARHGPLPPTMMFRSATGGPHRIFAHPGAGLWVETSASKLGEGIDVKGENSIAVMPPTVRPGVGCYELLNDLAPADAPTWLLDMVIREEPELEGRGDDGYYGLPSMDKVAWTVAMVPNGAGDGFDDRKEWVDFAHAIWDATCGDGFPILDAWSMRHPSYDAKKTEKLWDGIKGTHSIGYGSLYHHAAQAQGDDWYRRLDDALVGDEPDPELGAMLADFGRHLHGEPPSYLMEWMERERSRPEPEEDGAGARDEGPGTSDQSPDADTNATTTRSRVHAEPKVTPVDLWSRFEPPPLPTGLLPSEIEEFARERGKQMGADPAALAAATLAVCSAATPSSIKLKVKRHEDWLVSTCMWVGIVGPPSVKKTPLIRAAMQELERIDVKMMRKYVADKAQWDAMDKEEKKTAEPPRQTRLRIEDVTVESVQGVLRDSPDGVLLFRDELSGWFGSMDKYSGHRGAALDRGFWLQAYNGGSYALNRVGRGDWLIENMNVSLLGGIQNEPMRRIAQDMLDDGLIQRINPIMARPCGVDRDEPTSEDARRYERLVLRLHQLKSPFDNPIRFDDGAQAVRQEMARKHNEMLQLTTIGKKLAEHIGKYDGMFARMCLLWHCVEHRSDLTIEIKEKTARRVADFLHKFLLPHARAFYFDAFGLSDDHDRIANVADYILAHKLDEITNRVIQRGDRSMRGLERQDIDSIFHQLDALGWINRAPGRRATDPPRWNVNPEAHRLHKDRGEASAKRRKSEREAIATLLGRDEEED